MSFLSHQGINVCINIASYTINNISGGVLKTVRNFNGCLGPGILLTL